MKIKKITYVYVPFITLNFMVSLLTGAMVPKTREKPKAAAAATAATHSASAPVGLTPPVVLATATAEDTKVEEFQPGMPKNPATVHTLIKALQRLQFVDDKLELADIENFSHALHNANVADVFQMLNSDMVSVEQYYARQTPPFITIFHTIVNQPSFENWEAMIAITEYFYDDFIRKVKLFIRNADSLPGYSALNAHAQFFIRACIILKLLDCYTFYQKDQALAPQIPSKILGPIEHGKHYALLAFLFCENIRILTYVNGETLFVKDPIIARIITSLYRGPIRFCFNSKILATL